MSLVNPNLPVNLFIQPARQSVLPADLRQLELRVDQIVLATVKQDGLDRVVLELLDQTYRAETEKELQVGQQLKLQVTQVQPRLEFRVLGNTSADQRLTQLLPLLTRSYDWDGLTAQLQQRLVDQPQTRPLAAAFTQLRQLLNPGSELERQAVQTLAKLGSQWQPIDSERLPGVDLAYGRPFLTQETGRFSATAGSPVDKLVIELVQKLQGQISLLRQIPRQQTVSPAWLTQTRELLIPLKQDQRFLQQVPSGLKSLLITVVTQLRMQPKVTPQLMTDLDKILVRLKDGGAAVELPAKAVQSPAVLPSNVTVANKSQTFGSSEIDSRGTGVIDHHKLTVDLSALAPRRAEIGTAAPMQVDQSSNLSHVEGELRSMISLLEQIQQQKPNLPPGLYGRIEGLMERLQLSVADHPAMNGYNQMLDQLTQFLVQPPETPQGGQLGFLSQLFGFHLERELLQGKQREALVNLKSSLLNLQKEVGEDVSEPLRRLELFQLCKARLGEDQVQFLPLPFAELEEGYLLAEQSDPGPASDVRKGLNLSLSLRLSALGNIRIDMLYRPEQGLQMQIAGESLEKQRYFEGCADELRQTVQTVALKKIRFSADAQLPAKQLQKRLMPEVNNMLDARI